MKTRVLWIIDSLGHGGAERMTLSILEKFNREKFDLRVCTLQVKQGNPIGKELEKIGIPVDVVEIPVLRRLSNLPKLIIYIKKHDPDIIHTQLEFADTLGSIASKLLGKPCISTQHTLGNPQSGSDYWRNQLTWFSLRNFSTKVIAVSEDARKFYIQKAGIPNNKVVTIYNGIDLTRFTAVEAEVIHQKRETFKIPEGSVTFVTIAILREPKGIQYMLQAMPHILEKIPNFHYLVIGDGEYGETLKQLANSLGVDKNVIFAGQRKDINEILQISNCFVLPTLTEALPTVLIEAMAARKAIIASRVGGIPEMVTDGENGLLVEPGKYEDLAKTCIKLAQDVGLRDSMASKGNTIVQEKFNIENLVETISKTYLEAIKNAKGN